MKLTQRIASRVGAYIFFVLAACAFAFFYSSKWAYYWIAELYPLGEKFIPLLFAMIGFCTAIALGFFFLPKKIKTKTFHVIFIVSCALTIILFIYTVVLLFGLDKGFVAEHLRNGLRYLLPNLPMLGIAIGLPFFVSYTNQKKLPALVMAVIVAAMTVAPGYIPTKNETPKWNGEHLMPVSLQTNSLVLEATTELENLERRPGMNNYAVEIELEQMSAFNLAILEEVGNEVQYFRLQAMIDGEWFTFYRSEKIQAMRLCSFDAVTTDRVRLSIDKLRSEDTPARIQSLRLYNEPKREKGDFEVTAYQRLDGDVPTEVLAKSEAFVKTYARYYDVYSTIIVFAAVYWDENGDINFGSVGEEGFARELAALKKIISQRSNQDHEVKIIVTTLADGSWEDGHNGVNAYMARHWKRVADQTIAFVEKYELSGVDIDWEYPQTQEDWRVFDQFIARLDDGIKALNPGALLSGALSAWALGMQREILQRFDQIQYMAYDGRDIDGFQSSLEQAQNGLVTFVNNGADISKINIGIAAYGRPVNGSGFWKEWRTLDAANYWDSKYYNVLDSDYQRPNGGQVYDGTFCAPALAGDKTAYALFSGAGGVMLFRVACDKLMDDPNSVARGIENALDRHVLGW